MISVEEAEARIVAAFHSISAEIVPIAEAAGRVLAADAMAQFDQPPAAVSSMDGYALRLADAVKVPVTLRVVGSAPAGHPFAGKLGAGEA